MNRLPGLLLLALAACDPPAPTPPPSTASVPAGWEVSF